MTTKMVNGNEQKATKLNCHILTNIAIIVPKNKVMLLNVLTIID